MRFRFRGHVLDTGRRELTRAGEPVALEPQVFDVLVYLIRNRDRVVTRDDLLESVWSGRIVSEATIDSRVRAARVAVGDNGAAQSIIRTMQRKGVRFVATIDGEETPEPAPASLASPAAAAIDKPTIAVLPFDNMSSDPEQEFFSDGIAEDIITALARYPSLFVVARNSSFTFKGTPVDIKTVGQALGVRYVLEGSVRRAGDRIRVTAQLIETEAGTHIWAERYDHALGDIFAVQDNITLAVTTALAPAIAGAEQILAMRRHPGSLDAWAAYQRGLWHLTKMTARDNSRAADLFQQAIDLDPGFAGGYRGLALARFDAAIVHHEIGVPEAVKAGAALVRQAVHLDPGDAEAVTWLARSLSTLGDYEGGLVEARRALSMAPNLAAAHGVLGGILVVSGHPKEGLPSVEACMRLGPRDPYRHVRAMHVAMARYFMRDYPAAACAAHDALRQYPNFHLTWVWLTAALGQAGPMDDAREALRTLIALSPGSLDAYVRRRAPWIRQADHDHMLEGLRKTGWTE